MDQPLRNWPHKIWRCKDRSMTVRLHISARRGGGGRFSHGPTAEENALPSSSSYGEQPLALLLVTTSALTGTALPPPMRSTGNGNSPMRRLSLGPPPSYRSSSNNNTVSLPPTPPITPSSVIPFVSPQQPHPLHRLQHRTPICLSRRRYDEW